MKTPLLSLAVAGVLSGCNATTDSATSLQPALLNTPAVEQVKSLLSNLTGANIGALKDDVFINSSTLTLSPPNINDANGNPIMGKQLGMPDQFELLTDGKQCVIRYKNTQQQIVAPQLSCKVK